MEKIRNYLPLAIRYLLFATALTPLIYSDKTFYPYILGKTVFLRGLVELALLLAIIYWIAEIFHPVRSNPPLADAVPQVERTSNGINFFKKPLFILVALLFFSVVLSTIFAVDKYVAFWGTLDRGGGLFGELHYFIFLFLALLVFNKKDWLIFLKISLVVGLVALFYGLLQYFGVKEFPFALAELVKRPGSFIGNPSFLSAYLFFVVGIAALIFGLEKNLRWRVFAVFLVLISAVMIFLASTRGALLGLGVGFFVLLTYFSIFGYRKSEGLTVSPKLNLQKISIVLLILLIVSVGVFWLTRDNAFWQKIPGLNRFSGNVSLVPDDSSTQTRLISWQMSWEAFKARPLFGWGNDNYLIAWNKYYNPELAVYGETWLDRAHNQLLDMLVMRGFFGFTVYLWLFGTIFYLIFWRRAFAAVSPFVGSALVAYFIQNLFLFDETSSYLLFFTLLGFLINVTSESKEISGMKEILRRSIISGGVKKYAISILGIALAVFVIYVFYFYSYIPYRQGRDVQLARGGQKDFVKTQLLKAFYPYNFAQPAVRGYIIDFYYASQAHIFENDDFKMLGDAVLNAIDEVIASGSRDPRFYIRKNQILDVMALRDPRLYVETEKIARDALELAPNRHEIWYALALSVAKQERFEEAIALARKTTELNPTVARTHFYLALLLSVFDAEKNRGEILSELDKVNALDPALESIQPTDVKKISEIYFNLQEYDRLADFVMKKINGTTNKIFEPQYYEFVLRYYLAKRDAENFIKVADFVGKEIPMQKENMDSLADLARKGLWDILDNLP